MTTKILLANDSYDIKNQSDWIISLDNHVLHCSASNGKEKIDIELDPNKGRMTTILTINGKASLLDKHRIPKSILDGVLTLSDGKIKKRYGYFRDTRFLKFLDRNGLTGVKNDNPNHRWEYDYAMCNVTFYSDGNISFPDTHDTQQKQFDLNNASYLIIEKDYPNYRSCVLYTRRAIYKAEKDFAKNVNSIILTSVKY